MIKNKDAVFNDIIKYNKNTDPKTKYKIIINNKRLQSILKTHGVRLNQIKSLLSLKGYFIEIKTKKKVLGDNKDIDKFFGVGRNKKNKDKIISYLVSKDRINRYNYKTLADLCQCHYNSIVILANNSTNKNKLGSSQIYQQLRQLYEISIIEDKERNKKI